MPVTINVDMHRVIEMQNVFALVPRGFSGAVEAAVNDTIGEAQSRIIPEEVGKVINAPREVIASRVRAIPAKLATRTIFIGRLFLSGKRIPIKRFDPVQTTAGVAWKPYRSQGVKLEKSAFGPHIPRLGRNVYKRRGRIRTDITRVPGLNLAEDKRAAQAVKRSQGRINRVLFKNIDKRLNELATAINSGRPDAFRFVFLAKEFRRSNASRLGLFSSIRTVFN